SMSESTDGTVRRGVRVEALEQVVLQRVHDDVAGDPTEGGATPRHAQLVLVDDEVDRLYLVGRRNPVERHVELTAVDLRRQGLRRLARDVHVDLVHEGLPQVVRRAVPNGDSAPA